MGLMAVAWLQDEELPAVDRDGSGQADVVPRPLPAQNELEHVSAVYVPFQLTGPDVLTITAGEDDWQHQIIGKRKMAGTSASVGHANYIILASASLQDRQT